MYYSRLVIELESVKPMENSVMSTIVGGVNAQVDTINHEKRKDKRITVSKMNIVINCEKEKEEDG